MNAPTKPPRADVEILTLGCRLNAYESEAMRANRDRRRGQPVAVPLYTKDDVHAAMRLVKPLPYGARTEVLGETVDEEHRPILRGRPFSLWLQCLPASDRSAP